MRLGRFPWQTIPDDEFIANTRNTIGLLDRLRTWWILFNLGILVAAFWVFSEAFNFVMAVGNNANGPLFGFSTGAMIGLSASVIIHETLLNVVWAFANFRAERLLLRYYDAFIRENTADEGRIESDSEC